MSEAHLSREELIAWRDDGAGDRTGLVAHLAVCEACRELAAELERNRPVNDAVPRFDARDFVGSGYRAGATATAPRHARRWIWPAAAAALIVLALVPVWLVRLDKAPDTLRGNQTALVPVRPVDDVSISADELTFEWRGASATDRVRLNVVDLDQPDQPLIEREVTGSRYEPTADERRRFRSGQSVHWYLERRSGSGGPSPTARFRVR
jgi:hypothetical protein